MSQKTKGFTQNQITYTGTVRLSQYHKGKRHEIAEIHNEGGKPLFDFLADCLAGDFDLAKTNIPSVIKLLNVDEAGNKSVAANTPVIYMYTKPERVYSETAGIVRYSFVIPQEYFAAGNISGATRFNAIGLYTDEAAAADDFAAFCAVDTNDSNWDISMSSALVLDWELQITNEQKPLAEQ